VVAKTLADELANEVRADAAHHQELVSVAMDVAQWLADQGRPGRWDTVDAAAVLAVTVPLDEEGRNGYLLSLTGLLGFAALWGHIPIAAGRRTLVQIQGLATMPVVIDYVGQAIRQLDGAQATGAAAPV
jgi:hypothetical protein